MGPRHATSSAAGWLAGSLALQHFAGYHQSPAALAIGTVVCAGSGLLPDLDSSGAVTRGKGGATVAHTFGRSSLFVAECVEKVSLGVYRLTSTRKDCERTNGHRTFTHTLPFAGLVGWGTTALCAHYGRWAVLGILFVTVGLAFRGLFPKAATRAGWLLTTILSAGAAGVAYVALPAGRGYPLIGAAVGAGALLHILGDAITKQMVPLFWPIPLGGRMWRMVGLPVIEAGGATERYVLRWMFPVVAAASVVLLAHPAFWPTTTHPTPAPAVAHIEKGKTR